MAGQGQLAPGFIGRFAELRLLDRALDAAAGGVGSVVSVTGVAGIGKTWFCGEVVRRAGRRGFATVRGGCWPDGGAPPLWPWQDVLRSLSDDPAAPLLLKDSGGGELDPERFTRFVAVRDCIAEACARRPAVVVVDDLHDADPGAVLLSRFIGRQVPALSLVLILCRRTAGGREQPAAGDDHTIPVHLRGFDAAETADFLRAVGRPCRDDKLLEILVQLTEGHPLHLQRVAASGGLDGAPERGEDRVGTTIRSAVAALRPVSRRHLAHAAVLGGEPTGREAAVVAGVAVETMRSTIAEVVLVGLVAILPGDRFRFGHDLVRAAFESTLTTSERETAHARAATVLAAQIHSTADGWQRRARHAHHCLGAARRSPDDARAAVEASRSAAGAMITGFAYEEAAALLAAATSVCEQTPATPVPAALLTEWAEAVLMCGRLAEARALFDRAVTAAEQGGDMALLARSSLGLGGVWVNEHRTTVAWERVAGLQRRALQGLGLEETVLRQRLRMRLAVEELYRGRGSVEAALAALAETRRLGDGRALAEALSLCHHGLLTAAHTHDRLALAEELIAVAATSGEGILALLGLCWRTVDLFHLGDPRAAMSFAELHERADALGCLSVRYIVETMRVMLLIRAGRLTEAESLARSGLELGVRVGDADAEAYFGTHLSTIRWLQGREAEVVTAVGHLIDSPTLNPAEFSLRATAAYFAARTGDTGRARVALARITRPGLSSLPDSSTWLAGLSVIADTAFLLGDAAVAREVYELLEPYAELPIVPSLAVACLGVVHRPLGIAAATFGDLDRAIAHFESAVAANRALGNRPFTAIAAGELAVARVRRGHEGDRERARGLLTDAVREAESIGLAAYRESWQSALAALTERTGRIDRIGRHWEITVDGRRATVPDRLGVRYLAHLLLNPGRSISVVELAGGPGGAVLAAEAQQPVLDPAARVAYRRRVDELRAEIERADIRGEPERAERAATEMAALVAELRRVTGRAGRTRGFADPGERARTAVRKALKRAIDEIARAEPALGAELRAAVTTGATCCYLPAEPRTRWSSRTG